MELEIFVNGLIPITRDKKSEDDVGGSRIYIKIKKEGLETIEHITNADNNGEISFKISKDYVNADILIRIANKFYKRLDINKKVEDYGLYYTAKIEHDFAYWSHSGSTDPEWNTEEEYNKSDAIRTKKLREFRYKNISAKVLYYFLIGLSLLLTFLVPGGFGFLIAFIIVVLLEILSPYSIGLKKMFKNK